MISNLGIYIIILIIIFQRFLFKIVFTKYEDISKNLCKYRPLDLFINDLSKYGKITEQYGRVAAL